RDVVVKEEVMVRLVQLPQVPIVRLQGDGLGVGAPAVHASEQHVGRRLQIDDEIGRGDVVREQLVQPLIDEQLVVVEIEIREDLVFVEEVIADRDLAEEVCLTKCNLLTMTIQQIEQLRLQRSARA